MAKKIAFVFTAGKTFVWSAYPLQQRRIVFLLLTILTNSFQCLQLGSMSLMGLSELRVFSETNPIKLGVIVACKSRLLRLVIKILLLAVVGTFACHALKKESLQSSAQNAFQWTQEILWNLM
jgi:hypothetical protein